MKKFYSILSVALAFSMLAFTSCSDDDGDSINRTEVLTTKKWTVSKIEAGMADEYADITDSELYDCEVDDYSTFSKENVYIYAPGEDDCDGSVEANEGTWTWKDGEKILALTQFDETDDYTVVSMSATELKLKLEYKDEFVQVGGTTYYYTEITTYTGK
jgi:hypothetical protein